MRADSTPHPQLHVSRALAKLLATHHDLPIATWSILAASGQAQGTYWDAPAGAGARLAEKLGARKYDPWTNTRTGRTTQMLSFTVDGVAFAIILMYAAEVHPDRADEAETQLLCEHLTGRTAPCEWCTDDSASYSNALEKWRAAVAS
ncbi:hypothetical protein ACGFZP_12745 [Kitasatospora sp. NPDC048239]|uniref:hypothetical protein n=1 Tax=Kitasatospora sp. NPDC048239 TaxID=3364046 RepID=UPI00371C3B79